MSCAEGLLSCLQMHQHATTSSSNSIESNAKSLLSSLVNVVVESLADNPEYVRFRNLLSETIVKEIREGVRQHVDQLVQNNDAMEQLRDEIVKKNIHIEKLELSVFELQALLRSRTLELRDLYCESEYSESICDDGDN